MRLSLLLALSLFIGTVPVRGQAVTFEDVAQEVGVDHTFTGPSLGGGASFADFDGDGWDDISLVSGVGQPAAFFQNASGEFAPMGMLGDTPDHAESMLTLWADYDNDGDRDLFVGYAERPDQLFRNDGPAGFTEVTEAAGLSLETHPPEMHKTMAAAWGDYDRDGHLDLFVGNWGKAAIGEGMNKLYRSNGDGTFAEVGQSAGVDWAKLPLAVAFVDYDLDGWLDLYIANDKARGNQLFRNLGDGTFDDVSEASGADIAFHAMGIAIGDYDLDGDFDMYVSNISTGNGLLRNEGDGTFTEVADEAGVAVYKICWGVNFFDADNDGDLDLFAAAMFGEENSRDELFENVGDGTFAPWEGFVGGDGVSHGSSVGDFDADGYPDLAVVRTDSPVMLWHNSGGSNNWLSIALEGTESNRDGVGSLIEVHTAGLKQMRLVQAGSSYKSQDSFNQIVGIGSSTTVDSVVVRWPSGQVDIHRNVGVNEHLVLVEGEAMPTATGLSPAAPTLAVTPFPNPFVGRTTFQWSAGASSANRTLSVYDMLGRLVQQWSLPDDVESGRVIWDGSDDTRRRAASGAYVYRLDVGVHTVTGRVTLVR